MEKSEEFNTPTVGDEDETWVKPEVKSFSPVKAAEGISYQPSDGIYNLTP